MRRKKFNKISLIISAVSALTGILLIMAKQRIAGDIFLVISTIFWLYIFYSFIVWFITERK